MSELKEVTIYTDGCCIMNPGPGGYGVILCYNNHEKELSGGFRLTTSNRMEIMAAIVGLKVLKTPCSVTLYSDSKYLVESMTEGWVHCWKINNWWRNKKEKAVNIDLWEELLDLCGKHKVKFVWLKGHNGHIYNERCDAISKKAANQQNLTIDEGYEQYKDKSIDTGQLFIENLNHNTDLASESNKSFDTQKEHRDQKNLKHEAIEEHRKTETDKHSTRQIQVKFEGKYYIWTGNIWYDKISSLKPPKALINKLNDLLITTLEQEDDNIHDVEQLLKRAKEARDSLQYGRAQKLARRIVSISPDHLGAFAVLCSCLRSSGHAQQALDETEHFASENYLPLINSRAAALCDLERWEEAKKAISRVLAMSKDNDVAFSIVHRIKSARPDLYK
jgi:ribonuclease HI